MTTSPKVETLVERAEWIRSLARALVRDEHEAEDLAQEAWVLALAHPAGSDSSPGWLATILRNLARSRWRSARRRDARERENARPEGLPPASELVEQLDAHEALVRAVRELDEPYREAILLRFFEGLAPREIAARTGLPVKTVDTRIFRALALLRTKLDQGHRDRRAWLALLVPLVRPRDAALVGALAVQTKTMSILAAAAVVALLVVVARRGASDATPEGAAPFAAAGESAIAAPSPVPNQVERSAPDASGSAATAPSTPVEVAANEGGRFRGTVVDTHAAPVADLRVVFVRKDSGELVAGADAITDVAGGFELATPDVEVELDLVSDRWTMVLRPSLAPGGVIVVAPRRTLAGTVVDESGRPIEGARVELGLPPSLRPSIPLVLDMCRDEQWQTRADAAGAFELAPAPDIEGCKLHASFQGFATKALELESGDRLDLRVVLVRHAAGAHLIGRVLGPRGEAIEGARVAFEDSGRADLVASDAVASNASGEFELPLSGVRSDVRKICAVKSGYLPAELACTSAQPSDPGAWPSPLELVLDGTPLSISGLVLDASGHPEADVEVVNVDTSRFGRVEVDFGGSPIQMTEDLETLMAGVQYTTAVVTDEHGRFEMRGLLPKSYRLRAFDPRTMQLAVSVPIRAGEREIEIRFAPEERVTRIAGQVRGANGEPLADVDVQLLRRGPEPSTLSARQEQRTLAGRLTTTGADGRFEFLDAPRGVHGLRAQFRNSPIQEEVELASFPNIEGIAIVLTRTCHMKIDLTGFGAKATSFSVFDAQGKSLVVTLFRGNVGTAGHGFAIEELGTEALMVPETAAELVLSLANGESAHVRVHLTPGGLTIVRP